MRLQDQIADGQEEIKRNRKRNQQLRDKVDFRHARAATSMSQVRPPAKRVVAKATEDQCLELHITAAHSNGNRQTVKSKIKRNGMLQSSTENILVQDSNLQELHLSMAQSTFDLPKRKPPTRGSNTEMGV